MKKLAVLLLLCLLCAAAASCTGDDTKYQEMISRAQESFDSHLSFQQGTLSIPSGGSVPETSLIKPPADDFNRVEDIGTPGMDYSAEVMELLLPAEGVPSPDGWYMASGGKLRLYSHDGEVLWEKSGLPQSGTHLSASAFGVVVSNGSVLLLFDNEGNLRWQADTRTGSADSCSMTACITEDGYAYAAIRTDLCLSFRKYAPDGSIAMHKDYTGEGGADVYAMEYAEGHGLVVTMSCKWKDGVLTEGKTSDFAILLLGEDLSPLWINWQEKIYYQNLTVADGVLYAGSHDKSLRLSLTDGSVTAQGEGRLVSVGEKVYLQVKQDALTVCNKELKTLSELPIAGGTAERVVETADGGVLVITKHIILMLPTPSYISSLQYEYQWVYTRYNAEGEIVYRAGYDANRM